jgi:UDPglucose--hexose-1-phosphate uridylyltransferase
MVKNGDEPRTLREPTTDRPVLLAPLRQQRPHYTSTGAQPRRCPFCPGHEDDTPPEIDRDGDGGAHWLARAFANKYPANQHHEVIAEGQHHCEQPSELDLATWRAGVRLWQRRIRAIEARPGIACAFLFKNVGALAGASVEHNHSQLLGLPELPPRLQLEATQATRLPACPWCQTLASAAAQQRLVYANDQHAVVVPDPNKLPHETWLLPLRCEDDFLQTDAASLAAALRALFTAVARGLRRPAFNLWLHRIPGARFHWHFELQPRTGQMAGLELGGDMYINSVPPAVSAERLRRGLAEAASEA